MRYLSVILFTLFSFSLFSQSKLIPEASKDVNSTEALYSLVTSYELIGENQEVTLNITNIHSYFEKIESILNENRDYLDYSLSKEELVLTIKGNEKSLKQILYDLLWIHDIKI